jgi:hypothetical protein
MLYTAYFFSVKKATKIIDSANFCTEPMRMITTSVSTVYEHEQFWLRAPAHAVHE